MNDNNNQQPNKNNCYSSESENLEKTPASAGATTSCHSCENRNLVNEKKTPQKSRDAINRVSTDKDTQKNATSLRGASSDMAISDEKETMSQNYQNIV